MIQSGQQEVEVRSRATRFHQASQALAIFVATLGLVVFCGWAFDLPILTYIQPTFHSMKVNTAVSFVLLGAGLYLAHNDEWQRIRRFLGFLVVVIAGATLAEYAFHASFGIDQLLFRDTRTLSLSAYPGRMAIATTICLSLLGLVVVCSGLKKALVVQRSLACVCLAISLAALCGYVYGANSLYSTKLFSVIAVHTAAGLFLASLACFFVQSDEGLLSIAASDSNSGLLLRALFPAIVVVPILIGYMVLAGQRANLYGTSFGIVLNVLGSIGCFTALTVMVVRAMYRSEQRRGMVEEALEKSEEKFSKAFRESPMAVTLTRVRDHHYLDVNESFERWTGWRRDEVIGRTPLDIGLWANPAERADVMKRLLADGVVRNLEVRYRRKEGVEGIGLASAELIEIGNEPCIVSVIADISDRKRAEEAIKESELRFRLLADSTPALIWMSGPDMLFTYFNKPWLDFTGRSAESELGNGWTEGVQIEDLPRCMDTYVRAFDRREEFRMEYRLRRRDGEYRWVMDLGVPRYDQARSFVGYIGIAIDVTEQKRADEARSRYEAIVESSDDAIAGVDVHGTVTNWNKGAERLYGFSAMEAIGRHVSFVSPKDRLEEGREIFSKVMRGEPVRHYETLRRRKDGTCVDVSLTVSPIIDAEGRVVGASGIARDITERKRAEEALKGLSGQLIKAQEEERSRIAREIHDDYQQRLAMLSIDLETLAQRLRKDSETSSQLYGLWNRAGELGLDLHCLSHRLHSSTLDSLGIAAALRSLCSEFHDYHSIAVVFWEHNVPRDIPREVALCLFRIAQEALQNVRKHSSAESAEVRLEGLEHRIHLSVSDKGSGFDPTAAFGEGGIGIRSMEERVRLVGGQIAIRSRPMGGTEVDVWAPINS